MYLYQQPLAYISLDGFVVIYVMCFFMPWRLLSTMDCTSGRVSILFFKHVDSGGLDRLLDCTFIVTGILVKSEACTADLYISMTGIGFKKYTYSESGLFVTLTSLSDTFYFCKSQEVQVKISASHDELNRIIELCDACCKLKRGYNYWDKFVSTFLPLESDVDIFSAPTLHSSQAVVLILRASLDSDHRLQNALTGVNSRSMYSTLLHRVLIREVPDPVV